MTSIKSYDPVIYDAIKHEEKRQREGIELIPSENYVSVAVLEALGSVLTNKYSEGYPGKRYYGGCENIDVVESQAIERVKQLFGCDHANVQPLSGAPANIAVYFGILEPGDTILGMDLSHGGHLTHGHPVTHMAKIFNFVRYHTNAAGEIDLNDLEAMAMQHKPKLILVGYSAYSRDIDYINIKKIADKVGAMTMADVAHIAGLIAAGEMNNPVPYFDIITSTTHKTLRGPRGGLILCKQPFAKKIDKSVFPGFQGGPHENNIAAKAIAFKEALEPAYKDYARQIKANAKIFEEEFNKLGYRLMFGGTDNHLLLIDVTTHGITGKEAQIALDKAGITCNMNMIPNDPRPPLDPSGIRIGTPAMTTRGLKEPEMRQIVAWMNAAMKNHGNDQKLAEIKSEVTEMALKFPVPGAKA
ncbi:serine hydroxymethyltransferase [Patescibacteria group bacterium]|nr:serine hydroxymethyltransferase [Patescibacteria group bacterium]MBU1702818.1 serine hydroxymethyltransferase [Patescibacteria group bacterium]MBU1953789.1 serine hydroxymethyltransferase [Patescibacteria group bacterium]